MFLVWSSLDPPSKTKHLTRDRNESNNDRSLSYHTKHDNRSHLNVIPSKNINSPIGYDWY